MSPLCAPGTALSAGGSPAHLSPSSTVRVGFSNHLFTDDEAMGSEGLGTCSWSHSNETGLGPLSPALTHHTTLLAWCGLCCRPRRLGTGPERHLLAGILTHYATPGLKAANTPPLPAAAVTRSWPHQPSLDPMLENLREELAEGQQGLWEEGAPNLLRGAPKGEARGGGQSLTVLSAGVTQRVASRRHRASGLRRACLHSSRPQVRETEASFLHGKGTHLQPS